MAVHWPVVVAQTLMVPSCDVVNTLVPEGAKPVQDSEGNVKAESKEDNQDTGMATSFEIAGEKALRTGVEPLC